MKKLIALLLSLLMLASLLAGCGNGNTVNDGTEQEQRDDLIVCYSYANNDLDPMHTTTSLQYQMAALAFSSLVTFDSDGNPVARLADTWEISEDNTVFTFHLNENAKFHDGAPVTAQDVVFSFQTAQTSPYTAAKLVNMASAAAVDEHTVVITMLSGYTCNINDLASVFVVPEATYISMGDQFSQKLIGSGSFKLESINTATGDVVYVRNEDYFGTLPSLKKITFTTKTDRSTQVIALENGEVDWIYTDSNQYTVLSGNDKLYTALEPSTVFPLLLFNTNSDGLAGSKLFRQAVAYAINYDVLAMSYSPVGSENNTAYYAKVWGNMPETGNGFSYNPERAKELLAEAGVKTPVDFCTVYCTGATKSMAEALQQSLADVGINIKVEQTETATFVSKVIGVDYEMILNIDGAAPEAGATYRNMIRTGGGHNFNKYSNPEVDALVDEISLGNDVDNNIAKLLTILNDEVPQIHLFEPALLDAYNKNLNVPKAYDIYFIDFSAFSWN